VAPGCKPVALYAAAQVAACFQGTKQRRWPPQVPSERGNCPINIAVSGRGHPGGAGRATASGGNPRRAFPDRRTVSVRAPAFPESAAWMILTPPNAPAGARGHQRRVPPGVGDNPHLFPPRQFLSMPSASANPCSGNRRCQEPTHGGQRLSAMAPPKTD